MPYRACRSQFEIDKFRFVEMKTIPTNRDLLEVDNELH